MKSTNKINNNNNHSSSSTKSKIWFYALIELNFLFNFFFNLHNLHIVQNLQQFELNRPIKNIKLNINLRSISWYFPWNQMAAQKIKHHEIISIKKRVLKWFNWNQIRILTILSNIINRTRKNHSFKAIPYFLDMFYHLSIHFHKNWMKRINRRFLVEGDTCFWIVESMVKEIKITINMICKLTRKPLTFPTEKKQSGAKLFILEIHPFY